MAELNSVTIVTDSESEDDADADTTALLHHSYHVQSRATGFNVHSIPIVSAGAIPTQQTQTEPTTMSGPMSLNTTDNNKISDTKRTGFVPVEVSHKSGNLSTMESYEMNNFQDDGIAYMYHGCQLNDPADVERNQMFKDKKKNSLLSMLLLGLIVFFQSVGFVLYFADILLLNVTDRKTQLVSYVVLLISCLMSTMMSHAMINVFGAKWCIFIGCFGASIFTIGRFFSSMAFLVPAAIFTGLSIGPMYVAVVNTMTYVSHEYSSLSGKDRTTITFYFSGFLHSCTLLSPAFAALLRYVFLPGEAAKSFTDQLDDVVCFKEFCWRANFSLAIFEHEQTNQRTKSDEFRLQALLGTFLVCSLGAAVLAWFHTKDDMVPSYNDTSQLSGSSAEHGRSWLRCDCKCPRVDFDSSWLTEPFRRFYESNMMLLVPLFVYLGVQQYLVYSIFLQTYSQCSSHLFHAIIIAINVSLVAALCTIPTSIIISYIGKVKALVPVLAVQLVLMIVMVTTNDMGLPVQYVIAAFWGAADAVIHIAVFAIFGDVFGEEDLGTTVVCARACQIIGYLILATLQMIQACNYVILIFSISLIILATLCYVSLEIKLGLEKRESRETGSQYVPLLREASWLPDVNPVEVRRDRTESLTSRIPTIK